MLNSLHLAAPDVLASPLKMTRAFRQYWRQKQILLLYWQDMDLHATEILGVTLDQTWK